MKTKRTHLKGLQGTNRADLYTHTHTHTLIFEKPKFALCANSQFSSLSFSGVTRESTLRDFNASRCAQYAQSGRTLLETMAVLAIMGILSVAAVATYNYAINKARTNLLVQDAAPVHSKNWRATYAHLEPTNLSVLY